MISEKPFFASLFISLCCFSQQKVFFNRSLSSENLRSKRTREPVKERDSSRATKVIFVTIYFMGLCYFFLRIFGFHLVSRFFHFCDGDCRHQLTTWRRATMVVAKFKIAVTASVFKWLDYFSKLGHL